MKLFFSGRVEFGIDKGFPWSRGTVRLKRSSFAFVNEKAESFLIRGDETDLLHELFVSHNGFSCGKGYETLEMYGFNSGKDFAALNFLWGKDDIPADVPGKCTDLAQSVIEYMDLLDEEDFENDPAYLYLEPRGEDDSYTREQKLTMFLSHRDCPIMKDKTDEQDDAMWVRLFYYFFESHKEGTIAKINLLKL